MSISIRTRTIITALAAVALIGAGSGAIASAALAPGRTVVPAAAFPDVPEGTFYTDAVQWAKDNGVTTGVGSTGLFKPDATVSRGEMVTFLQRLANLSLPREEIVVSTSTGHVQPHAGFSATVAHYAGYVTVQASSLSNQVVAPLSGPTSFGGVDYVLESVRFCVSSGDAVVDHVVVYADYTTGGHSIGSDSSNVAPGSCHTVEVAEAATNPEVLIRATDGTVTLSEITSTWVPESQFQPSSLPEGPVPSQEG